MELIGLKNKPRDVLYCGVDKQKIMSAKPELDLSALKTFAWLINERYKIHLRKDVEKKPAPWTKNPILQKYRFTNVRREHDTESKWLIKHIALNKDLSYEDKLMNCVLFRLFNKFTTSEIIGQPIKFDSGYKPRDYFYIFNCIRKENPKYVFFSGAFMNSGLKRTLKKYIPRTDLKYDNACMRMMYFMEYLRDTKFPEQIQKCKTQQQVYEIINSYNGLGEFLSYQIFVDFTYIPEFPFSENEFVIAGIGCKRGINYLFKDKSGLNYEECLFWLRDNWDEVVSCTPFDAGKLFIDLPKWDRKMNIMSLENCFCEFGKYMKAKKGTGRPRLIYKHKEENI